MERKIGIAGTYVSKLYILKRSLHTKTKKRQSRELNHTRYFMETSPIFTSPWWQNVARLTQFKPFNLTALIQPNNCCNLMSHVAAKPVLGPVKIFIMTWAGNKPKNPWKETVTLLLSYSGPCA